MFMFQLVIPEWKTIEAKGKANYKMKESFESDLEISGLTDNPIKLLGRTWTMSSFTMILLYSSKYG